MVITYSGTDSVTLKTKTETVMVNPNVTIGSFSISGAGEYDIASIQCEGKALTSSVAYFVRAEDLVTCFMSQIDPTIVKLDDASNSNILIVDVRSDDTPESLKPIVKALEPSYVALVGAGATKEFTAALGLPEIDPASLKITRTGLPLEGTSILSRS